MSKGSDDLTRLEVLGGTVVCLALVGVLNARSVESWLVDERAVPFVDPERVHALAFYYRNGLDRLGITTPHRMLRDAINRLRELP